MEDQKMFLIPASESLREIRQVIADEVKKQFQEQKHQTGGERLYYVNQIAQMLHKSHKTVKKMVLAGILRSTKNGMIPESAVEEFLKGN